MIRKILRKNIDKWFPIFFNELLKKCYLQRLFREMISAVNNRQDLMQLHQGLKEISSTSEELQQLYNRLKPFGFTPAELSYTYSMLKPYSITDEELTQKVFSTLDMLKRRNTIYDIQNIYNNLISKDYEKFITRHGENFRIESGAQIYGGEHVTIGDNFHAGRNFRIQTIPEFEDQKFNPHIEIGNNVSFEDYCHVGCIDNITIGDGTLIASKVFIADHYHGNISADELDVRPGERPLSYKPISIGKNVWIGDGACIMPGVTLGDNVIVGANAVVTHSFERNLVIAGCPAKIIRTLNDN